LIILTFVFDIIRPSYTVKVPKVERES